MTLKNKPLNLLMLSDECGKVMRVCNHIRRTSISADSMVGGKTNRQALLESLGELHALLAVVTEDYDFDISEMDSIAEAKIDELNANESSEVH